MATTPSAPSAGADNPTEPVVTPSPSETPATPSDDELLGLETEDESGAAPAEPGAEAGAEAATGEPTPEEVAAKAAEEEAGEKPEVIEPDEEVTVPEEFKALFKMEGVGPKVRDLFYRTAAFQAQFPTVAEARSYKEVYPTLEDAKAAREDQTALESFDQGFYSQDPAEQATVLQGMHKEDPDAFRNVMARVPQVYSELDPEGYKLHLATPIVQDTLQNLRARAVEQGGAEGENLKNAVDVLAMRLFGRNAEQLRASELQADPRTAQLERGQQELAKQKAAFEQTQFEGFHRTTNDSIVTQVVDQIKTTVDKVLEGVKVTAGAKQEMIGLVYRQIDKTLRANRDLRAQLRREFRGERSQEQQEKIVSLMLGRMRPLLRSTAQRVISDYTKNVLGLNETRLSKQRTTAGRPDITGKGGTHPAHVPGVKPGQVDYNLSDDDAILDGKTTLRK